jgi:hypothetical protein
MITTLASINKLNTRAKNNNILCIPRHRCARYDKSYVIKYSRMWNDLPKAVRDLSTLKQFKNVVFCHFLKTQKNA